MDPQIPSWLQAGGVLAFAAAVWWELRAVGVALTAMQNAMTALLERERIRDPDLTPTHGTPLPDGYRRPRTPERGVDVVRIPVARARSRVDDE